MISLVWDLNVDVIGETGMVIIRGRGECESGGETEEQVQGSRDMRERQASTLLQRRG